MMLFTLLIFIVWCSFVTYYSDVGGFRHLYYLLLDGADTERITYWNYLIQFITTFSYAPAKTAVAILVLRIVGPKATDRHGGWRKWLIYVTMTLVWITTTINCIMTYVQCDPPTALWNEEAAKTATCWDPEVEPDFAMWGGALNVFADAVLAIIPASLIYNLNMDIKKRINLCILLGLGVIAAVCGIVKMTYLGSLSEHEDITWETYNLIVWAGSELFVLIFCGSVPPIKPVWDRYVIGKNFNTTNKYGYTGGSSKLNPYSHGPYSQGTKPQYSPGGTLLSSVGAPDYGYSKSSQEAMQVSPGIEFTTVPPPSHQWNAV